MSGKGQVSRGVASEIAAKLLDSLDPATTRRQVVGSLRRGAETVGDIELLVAPVLVPVGHDLFGNVVTYRDDLECWCREQLELGNLQYRMNEHGNPVNGERYKRFWVSGVALDLFICRPPAQWGVLELIRTGPSAFSQRFVSAKAAGGWLPFGWRVRDGALWDRDTLIETPAELDVFAALGQAYVRPEDRG